jgi:hypothetical protein
MLYISRKRSVTNPVGTNQHSEEDIRQSGGHPTTAESVAKETGVSPRTIERDAKYAEACDKLGITTAQFDNATLAMLLDPAELAVDPRTPLAALIEAEEEQAGETLDLAGIAAIPPDALAIMLRFLLPDGRPTSPTYWKQAARRLAALAHAVGVREIREHSLTSLATPLECSKALLSLLACELRDFGQLDNRAGRSATSREVYSERAKQVWNRRGLAKRERGKTSL